MKVRSILFILIFSTLVLAGKKEVEEEIPNFSPPDSTGFNMTVEIWEIDDTMMSASDETFVFDAQTVEVTDSTGRFVRLNSLIPPARAKVLITEENKAGRFVISRIRITSLFTSEREPRSLQELTTDKTVGSKAQTPSDKAVFGTSHDSGEKK